MSPSVFVIALRRASLLAFLAFVVLFDPLIPFRPVMATAALVAGVCTIGLIIIRRRRGGEATTEPAWLWPGYALYLGGVGISAAVNGAPGVWPAVGDQICFVLLLWSVCDAARPAERSAGHPGDEGRALAAWLVAVIVCLALVLLQIAGPRSGFEYGRPYHYRALQQWSGYPELGVLCLLGGAAAWAMCLAATDRGVRGAAAVLAFFFAIGLVFLQSRAALAVFALVAAWLAIAAAWRWRSWLAVAALVAGAAAVTGTMWRYPELARRLVTASASTVENDRPLDTRGVIWSASWTLVRAHPWAGVGPGQFQRAYTRSGAPGEPGHAHSLPLHVAAEYGIPTMVCYLVLWGRLLWRTWRSAAPSIHGAAAWAIHALLLAFLLRNLVDHFLGGLSTSLRMLALVAFVLGLAECVASRPDRRVDPAGPGYR
jgi:hypothetical protein